MTMTIKTSYLVRRVMSHMLLYTKGLRTPTALFWATDSLYATLNQRCGSGSWKRWKRSFFCGSGSGSRSAKNLPLPLPNRLFDLKSNLAKKFCPFPDVD